MPISHHFSIDKVEKCILLMGEDGQSSQNAIKVKKKKKRSVSPLAAIHRSLVRETPSPGCYTNTRVPNSDTQAGPNPRVNPRVDPQVERVGQGFSSICGLRAGRGPSRSRKKKKKNSLK